MQKFNIVFFVVAVAVAGFVLFVSLQSANQQLLSAGEQAKVTASKFYVTREILPDHALYPLLMVLDRLRLEMAEGARKSDLQLAYAKRRMFYAKKLLEKGNQELAYSTLSKALHYLNQSGADLSLGQEFLATYGAAFSDEYRASLESLIDSF